MPELLDYLRQMNLTSVLLRLLLAMLFGGLIGLERERKRRPAGFRTYMLVCLGAALTMLLSQYEYYMVTHEWAQLASEVGIRTDVSRFGAQVINGIGFLGAGVIVLKRGETTPQGLTTAAAIWVTAALGCAAGLGDFAIVLSATLLTIVLLIVNHSVERLAGRDS